MKFALFKQIVADFSDIADFIIIYVREAHPVDEWNILCTKFSHLSSHTTQEERLEAARLLLEEGCPCPLLIDSMDNSGAIKYAATPERLFIIYDDVIQYAGQGAGPENYKPESVIHWLTNFRLKNI
ncbi:type I iodothyronine deiodinase-like [Saccostrea cucullata]|uniref:type I iodothyronine deiodinase-like n=1 Tax=Saccostrea cuccullata TaxID=36930 RepID=UPI002ED01F40